MAHAVLSMLPARMRHNFTDDSRYIADSTNQSEFLPDEHKKFDAKYYFKAAGSVTNKPADEKAKPKLEPMEEPQRSEVGRRAYQDFIDSLRVLGQMEPLDAVNEGADCDVKNSNLAYTEGCEDEKELAKLAQLERVLENRKAARAAYRFEERLKARVSGFIAQGKGEKDPIMNPAIGRPAIRPATLRMLTAQPEADFDVAGAAGMGFTALLYVYTLYNQLSGIMHAGDGPFLRNTYLHMSQIDTLWAIFVFKEVFLISLPLFYIAVAMVALLLLLVLSPVAVGLWFGKIANDPKLKKDVIKIFWGSVVPGVMGQLVLFGSLCLSLSTLWRVVCIVAQLAQRKCNRSAKDFDDTMTLVSNMMFNLILMMVAADDESTGGLLLSLCTSLFSLLKMLVGQGIILNDVCDGLKDINENRLSKFELALVLTKISDIMLDDDIQYNFVEHLYTGQHIRLTPDIDPVVAEDENKIEDNKPEIPKELLALAEKLNLRVENDELVPLGAAGAAEGKKKR